MSQDILIIDDDVVDRTAIRRYLARPGRTVTIHEASTGQEAIDMIARQEYGCIFLDYRLPDMDGVTFLRRIYDADADLAPSPVVMLTGQGSEGVMTDALRWGAQDYLIKDNISADTINIAFVKAREVFELKKSHRQAEDQLRQAQKMEAIGQLTSGVAHDFNNLLTVILGSARLIQRRLDAADEELSREGLAKKIKAIEVAAHKGAELVRSLMIFTRQRPLQREITDINTCVRRTCDLLQASLGATIEVKTALVEDPYPIQIDVSQFENALINIAVNARDAMPRGGKLTFETQNVILDEEYTLKHPHAMTGPHAMVAISDTGVGMSSSVARRIFEPFYTTKAAGEGTGLGLSMVYGFIKQSNGYVHVYSEEGHGTVFRIYIPKAELKGEGHPGSDADDDDLPKGNGAETVLVVDDDDEVRAIAVSILEHLEYKVLAARDGRTALEILKRANSNVSLVFVDVVMPEGMSGVEFARKALEYAPGLKVLFTSGYTKSALPDYQLPPGQDLVGKPYSKKIIARKVRQVLDGGGGMNG